jgi:quinoprotein glucose dehydrogenase
MGCVNCHGANRQGQLGIPDLNALEKKYTAHDIVGIIHTGRQTMPAFPQIKGAELDQLIDYLLNIKDKGTQSSGNTVPNYRSWGYVKFLDKEGYPATKPPWGTLNAVDLTTGKIKWKVPLGAYKKLTDMGIPTTGTENFGGCIATKGGLIFTGATRDLKFRAFDTKTGKVLWETQLPNGGFATPSTYAVNGKQYVIIAATGGGKLGPPTGDTYVAFALPAE